MKALPTFTERADRGVALVRPSWSDLGADPRGQVEAQIPRR